MTTANWMSEYFRLIDDCEKRESKLTEWETGFIASIKSQLEKEKPISSKQIEKLEMIWDRVTRL